MIFAKIMYQQIIILQYPLKMGAMFLLAHYAKFHARARDEHSCVIKNINKTSRKPEFLLKKKKSLDQESEKIRPKNFVDKSSN